MCRSSYTKPSWWGDNAGCVLCFSWRQKRKPNHAALVHMTWDGKAGTLVHRGHNRAQDTSHLKGDHLPKVTELFWPLQINCPEPILEPTVDD